eukprot:8438309-Pyramimonas_sp.AAC.1
MMLIHITDIVGVSGNKCTTPCCAVVLLPKRYYMYACGNGAGGRFYLHMYHLHAHMSTLSIHSCAPRAYERPIVPSRGQPYAFMRVKLGF